METKRNGPFRAGRGVVSGGGLILGLLGSQAANAQTPGDTPNDFIRIDALEGVTSYEVQPDGTLKVQLADGRTIILPANAFFSTEAGLYLDLPVLSEAMTAAVAATTIAGSPLILPFLAAGGAGAAAAAAAGGGGGSGEANNGGNGGSTTPPPPTNRAPVFTSPATATAPENTTGIVYTAAATDADGNALTYSLAGTDAAHFTINSATGAVTFRSPPDFEAPADTNANNIYDIVVSASDGTVATTQAVTINVTNVNDSPPVFTSESAATVAENATGPVYTATAIDADGNAITYVLSGTDASLFNINAATGAVTFKVAPDFEAPSDAGSNNVYEIVVSASDGAATTSRAVMITVTNQNDTVPVFTSGNAVTVSENTAGTVYTASAVDADGGAVSYALSGTDAALFAINGATGAVTFKTPPDYESPLDAGGGNTYNIVVSAFDGVVATSQAVVISVTNIADNAPVFSSGISAAVVENSTAIAYTAIATSAEGAAITYGLSGIDAGLFNINAATGAFGFKTAPDFEAPADAGADNVYNVIVSASDGSASASRTVAISVTNANDSTPVFTSGGSATVLENVTGAVYTAVATDADGGALAYALSGTDSALFNINAATGIVTFKAPPDFEAPADVGADNVHNIVVSASDGIATTLRAVAITVGNTNDNAPVITMANTVGAAIDSAPAAAGSIAFSDADFIGPHTVSVAPAGAAYAGTFSATITDPAGPDGTGVVSWTYAANSADLLYLAAGETLVQSYALTLSDGAASVARTVVVTITGTNQGPLIQGAAQSSGVDQEHTSASGAISFSDRDLADNHSIAVTPSASGYLGVFSASIGNAATGDGAGRIDWAFAIDSSALHYLVAGETLTQTYAVTVSDTHGGSSVQNVTIFLNGQNDTPTITSAVTTAAIVEDGTVSASGIIAFADPDAGSVHTASIEALGSGYIGAFNATITDASAADGAGQLTWTFAVDNAVLQWLGAGEVLTQTYTVRLQDGAAVVTRNVVVTLTGANDAPLVSSSVVATNQDLAISGTLAASDVEGDALAFSLHAGPQHGTVMLQSNGAYVYTPASGYSGADSFTFDVSDGHTTTTGTVTIDVARGEFRVAYMFDHTEVVTSAVAGNHGYPEVAALSGGGHIVAWSAITEIPDGFALQVYAQRYDVAGVKAGAAILVDRSDLTDQTMASVAGLSDGGFVVVWQGVNLFDGSGRGIFAQRYTADGVPTGGEIAVNAFGFLDPQEPSVTALTGGGFAVSWTATDLAGESLTVYASVFDAGGVQVVPDFVVNTEQAGIQLTQGAVTEGIAGLAGGRFAIVFADGAAADGDGSGVYVRVFEANGTPVTAAQVLVSTHTAGSQQFGSISALTGGGFVVTWTDDNEPGGSGSGVFAQRFDANGAKAGGEIHVNTETASDQLHSKVEQLRDGGFVVVWEGHSAGEYDIHGQRFDATGGKVGAEFTVTSPAGSVEELPSTALRENGTLALVWRGQDGSIDQTIITTLAEIQGDVKSLVGGAGPDILFGWDKADVIQGGSGDDRVAGLGGADTLTGGSGRDHFIYVSASEGGDAITDFTSGQDKIEVSASGFGGGLSAGGSATLVSGANPVAASGNGAFLYDTDTGELFWDRDGAGVEARELIATLAGAPSIAASDIVVSDIGSGSSTYSDLGVISAGMSEPPTIETLAANDQFIPGHHIEMEMLTLAVEAQAPIEPTVHDADPMQPALQDDHGWQ